jgi:ABC-type nitrate/sulfonate/bicarbonate transport system substrate-binding protein
VTYIQNLHLDCTVVPFQDASAMIGGLASKRVDALVGGYAFFSQAVKDGKAKILIDTTNAQQRAQYVPSGLPENAFWGLTKTVKAKRAVIIPWLRAIDKARVYIANPANTAQIAKMLIDKGYAQGMEQSSVEHDIVDAFRSYLPTGPQPGYITKAAWDKQLGEAVKWKVPNFDAKAPTSQYDQAVDMSYYTAALGKGN